VLLSDKDLGIAGGQLKNYNKKSIFNYNYNLNLDPIQKIELKNPKVQISVQSKTQKGYPFIYCDSVLNCFLARREVFDDIQYDENFKLVEHLDFFLRLKKDTQWKVAFTDKVTVEHNNDVNTNKYMGFRNSVSGENVITGKQHFKNKWSVELVDIPIIK